MTFDIGLLTVLFLVLVSEFINGWTDAPNAIATVVATRVLKPKYALILAPLGNIFGAFLGTEVAKTIGTGIVKPEGINLVTLGAAMVGIITWGMFSWYFGLPISKSHAMVAGLAGAGLATAGPSVLLWAGWEKVIIGLLFSSILGLVGGWFVTFLIRHLFYKMARAKTNRLFSILQTISATGMALSHGSNDGQKFIGIFTLALVLGGVLQTFEVQRWVIMLCSLVMGIGTSIGGWRIIKTMGEKMVKMEPYQGFAAETAATGAILFASHLGIPLSTTHTINTSIMGVGAATRLSGIRWGVVREIVVTWLMTFPICALIGFIVATIFKFIFT
jgi:PiT family inorganic phosphate transporter